ncbi:MAG: hypothetical protein JXA25_12085 [Anaerolineales bacterium]|nr:hypothetical protein [Anaerolineales bacterium]
MKKHQSNLVAGILLILIGGLFLAGKLVPGLAKWLAIDMTWPLIVVGVGVLLLFLGLLTNAPGMAVPACVVGGIGGLLYYQNLTGDWDSWSYAWALIPGFVGVGILLSGLLGEGKKPVREGLNLITISLVMFAVFGSFFGALGMVGDYWPVLLIALGVFVMIRSFLRK